MSNSNDTVVATALWAVRESMFVRKKTARRAVATPRK